MLLLTNVYGRWGVWLAQLLEHAALDLRVMSSSHTLGKELGCLLTYLHTYIHKQTDIANQLLLY